MTLDMINGCLEIGGALITLMSVRQLRRDRVLRGAHWGPTIFFTGWGVWNLFYYPSLSQPLSTAGSALLVGVNALYLSLMVHYTRRPAYRVRWRSEMPPHHPNCRCECARSSIDGLIRQDPSIPELRRRIQERALAR